MKDAEYKGLMVDISVVDGAKQHAVLEFLPKIPSVGDMIDSRRLGIVEVSTVILRTAAVNSVIGSGVPRPEVDVVIVCRPVSSKQISRRRIPVNALYSPQERLSQLA